MSVENDGGDTAKEGVFDTRSGREVLFEVSFSLYSLSRHEPNLPKYDSWDDESA